MMHEQNRTPCNGWFLSRVFGCQFSSYWLRLSAGNLSSDIIEGGDLHLQHVKARTHTDTLVL